MTDFLLIFEGGDTGGDAGDDADLAGLVQAARIDGQSAQSRRGPGK